MIHEFLSPHFWFADGTRVTCFGEECLSICVRRIGAISRISPCFEKSGQVKECPVQHSYNLDGFKLCCLLVWSAGLGWNDKNAGTRGREENCMQNFGRKAWNWRFGRRLRLDEVKIDLSKGGWKGVDWIHLTRDWNWWRAVVKAVMNRLVIHEISLAE